MQADKNFTEGIRTCRRSPSSTIPMPRSHIHRTDSEEQLDDSMAAAEESVFGMAQRIAKAKNCSFQATMMKRTDAFCCSNISKKSPDRHAENPFSGGLLLNYCSSSNGTSGQEHRPSATIKQEIEVNPFRKNKQDAGSNSGCSGDETSKGAKSTHRTRDCSQILAGGKTTNEIDDECMFKIEI